MSSREPEVDVENIYLVDEFEVLARRRLLDSTYGYVAGGAGREQSVGRNREVLDSHLLVPRILRDVESVSTSVTILGRDYPYPLLVAPSALQRLSHLDGEMATARAALGLGLPMVLSMNSSTTVEDVSATGVDFWMQIYFTKDRGQVKSLLRRAEDAGALALCLTVDSAGVPTRPRELKDPLVVPDGVDWVHLGADENQREVDRSLDWSVIEWIRGVSTLPIVLKGVLHHEDARIAAESGVDALIVSNHGGRQLDGSVSAYDVLGPILETVAGRCEVLADGGIRSGNDLLKVLALGAKAGLVGRPVWWSLAAAGEVGVTRALHLIASDFEEAMRLCGVASTAEIDSSLLMPK